MLKMAALSIAIASVILVGCNEESTEAYIPQIEDLTDLVPSKPNKPDSWYEDASYPETQGHITTFGWYGDKHAAIAYRDGSFRIRDGQQVVPGDNSNVVGFDLYQNKTKMDWYNEDGYLPVMISEFIHYDSLVKIKNFANKIIVDGNDYVVAYSRVQVYNPLDTAVHFDPKESRGFIPLGVHIYEIGPGETVNFDFAIGLDRFGKDIPFLTNEQIIAAGSWNKNHAEMKAFWDGKLSKLIQFEILPDPRLIEAFKTGYVYTHIVRDGDDLHIGENHYDMVFDHDSIGIIVTLLNSGDFDDAKALLNVLKAQTMYDDAKYKYAWAFALYYQKTGDLEYVESKFEDVKSFVRQIDTDRTGPNGIMKSTNDIDTQGFWSITNYSALFGLSAYEYLANVVDDDNEKQWAIDTYNSLYSAVESTLNQTIAQNDLNYIPAGMLQPNDEIPRLAEPKDANWASQFMFGRWSWDGYLFSADQTSASGSGAEGVMITKLDDTYSWGFDRLDGILPPHNFGGYPHGWYSSSYNAGYGAAGLRGEKYRSEGIRAYQYMIENTQSGPYAWWEAIDTPTTATSWEGMHPVKGGEEYIAGDQHRPSGGSSPHMWGQAVASKVLIQSLVAERMNGEGIIGRGIPSEWLVPNEEIKISQIPLANNKRFAFHMVAGEDKVAITFSGDTPDGDILIDLPVFIGGKIESTNAGEIENDKGRVRIPATTIAVEISYSR